LVSCRRASLAFPFGVWEVGTQIMSVQEEVGVGRGKTLLLEKCFCDTHGIALRRSGLGRSNTHGACFDTLCEREASEL